MKVLVIYFSHTGNTEKIASAIYKEASQANDAVLKKLEDVDPDSLSAYDQIFIGSPIHAGSIAKEIKIFISKLPSSQGMKLAGFITHAAPDYPQQAIEQMTQAFVEICENKEMEYKGCFNCQGYLADSMHDAVRQMQKVDDKEWREKVKQMTDHPDANDEANAGTFAKSVLS